MTPNVRHLRALVLLASMLVLVVAPRAHAERLELRTYGRADGLTSLASTCLIQDGKGGIVACSQDGLFSYGAHRFAPIGHGQGLPDAAWVKDLVRAPSGFVYVRYTNALYVSDRSLNGVAFSQLRFRRLPLETDFFNDGERQMAAWSGGLALIDNDELVDFGSDDALSTGRRLALPPDGKRPFGHLNRLFSVGGALWFTTTRNEICRYDPGQPDCIGASDGLPNFSWRDLTAGEGRLVLARSDRGLTTIDPVTRHVDSVDLPDQQDWPTMIKFLLGFFHDPQGRLMTQSTSGLIVQTPSGWQQLSLADLPHYGGVAAVLADRSGGLWIGTWERGVSRVLGYGNWDSLDPSNGSADGLVWGTTRDRFGHLWVTTDSAVQEYDDSGGTPRLFRSIPGGAYALAVGPEGRVWVGGGSGGLRIVDPVSGQIEELGTSEINALAVDRRRVWVGTVSGLLAADVDGTSPVVLRRASPRHREVTALSTDGQGGAWFTSGTTLVHLGADGRERAPIDRWPVDHFQPLCMSRSGDDLWVGGSGGLFELKIVDGQIVSTRRYDASVTGDDTVVAVDADRQGRIWVGTGSGIAAFDGRRWVSADATTGLVWDDVGQNGINEDVDGTIWIATGNGLSHLLHPDRLFDPVPPNVVAEALRFAGRALPLGRVPFGAGPFTFTLTTTHYASEDSIRFRYRMSGVDADWVTAPAGELRYASVPPGKHVLAVEAEDTLTHLSSAPIAIPIRVGWPWWRRWWAEIGEGFLALGTAVAAWRWQAMQYERNQQRLEHLVAERTQELELRTYEIEESRRRVEDQAALLERQAVVLRTQAMRDGLTGLLNRVTIERQLAERLGATDGRRDCAVALIDVDHFKQFNDRFGHLRGDQVLRDTARRIVGALGPNDAAGRYGGEEFIVVLDDRDGGAAERLLALHERIRGECFLIGETPERVTASVGLAWLRPDDGWESLVGRADKALYAAKRAGRDRIAEEETPRPRREGRTVDARDPVAGRPAAGRGATPPL